MYTTAWALGFRGSGEDLYEPVYNVELGARLLKKLIEKASPPIGHLWPVEIALARYNGGSLGNPGSEGKLRNQKYVNRVLLTWAELVKKEKECDD
jgi:soluble lytic murein transglycosylase-like protein